ncbi:MAG: pentapeptide repeat-containing protein, partial [Okeania sp. SIO2F4]|uniref:pentapeptide repeat-containing protein n=1 Tax=Okeania sp. SIO2F4 TaxID=2607790 RepID=UPI00142B7E5F
FNVPVIPLLFLSLAAYSTLFDANSRETYSNIFKAFFRLGLSGIAFLFAYFYSVYSVANIDDLIILILVITLELIIILKFWPLIQAKKFRRLKWLFWVSSILFFSYSYHKENLLNYLYDTDLTKVIEKITFIIIVWLLSLLVLSTYNFANLSLRSEWSTKWLGWWYFINLVLPTSLISMLVFISSPDLYWFRDKNYWLSFFVLTLSIWLIFLLPISFFDIHKFRTWLKERIKKQWIYQFLIFLGLTLFVLFKSYLVANSITIIFFFIEWFKYGELSYYVLDLSLYLFVLALVFILFALSFVWWIILMFTKNKIVETKQKSFQLQKIKSQYSIFRDLAVSFRCINSTNFGEANLTEADFSRAEFTSVNFHGAKLNYTIWTQVKGLECVATGNTYLKYPKVRNWVIQLRNDIKSP